MTRILILGASHSEYPIIQRGLELGHEITTMGVKRFSLTPKSDHFYLDYSQFENVKKVVSANKIERIISGCNDFAAISAASVAEHLGIKHDLSFETALEIHSKNLWVKTFQALDIPVPLYKVLDLENHEVSSLIGDPLSFNDIVVKPVDMTGGKGVFLANQSNLEFVIRKSMKVSRQKKMLLQEKIDGTLHSAITLISGQQKKTFFADELVDDQFRVRVASTPSILGSRVQESVQKHIKRFLDFKKITEGVFHIQFIFNNDSYKIIDICARTPGDLYPLIFQFQYDFSYTNFVLNQEILVSDVDKRIENTYTIRFVEDKKGANGYLNKYETNVIRVFEIKSDYSLHEDLELEGKIIFLKFKNIDGVNEFISDFAKI
jgi:hypothetical protein